MTELVVPGDIVGTSDKYTAGEGTYIFGKNIHSSIVGYKSVKKLENTEVIDILRPNAKPIIVPKISDEVIALVNKVNPRQAQVKILCVGDVPLAHDFPAIVRQREVRQTQVDQVEMYKCFRPGDVIRAEVISLGDKNSYYLSTAKNEYGVIFAQSVAGATMIPISWDMMQCPKTKMTEHRKVAKV
eukprot:TRINITY_DN108_c6_g1_i1.p1 TRINITY_DN108_c6_g1~~TRINITY_DN108_c6_g1_i1.p1  ORF type:complete len:185 (-),score=37.56 TRINITY_DN108_c6_g1_i1:97-651(-)